MTQLGDRRQYIEDVFSSALQRSDGEPSTFDVTISVDDEVVYVHSFLVQHHSRRLANRIKAGKLVLPSDVVSKEAIADIRRWMYGLEVSPSSKEVLEKIESAAHQLEIAGLVDECSAARRLAFDSSTAAAMYEFAQRRKLIDLARYAYENMCADIKSAAGAPEFLRLSIKVVHRLLSDDCLLVNSELDVLDAAVRWLSHDWDTRLSNVAFLISAVRFRRMSTPELLRVADHHGHADMDAHRTKAILETAECRRLLHDAYVDRLLANSDCRHTCRSLLERLLLGCSSSQSTAAIGSDVVDVPPSEETTTRVRPDRCRRRCRSSCLGKPTAISGIEKCEGARGWQSTFVVRHLNDEQTRSQRMCDVFVSLRNDEFRKTTCDIELTVGQRSFLMHRFLLMYHNPWMAHKASDGTPQRRRVLHFDEIPAEPFDVIYRWMYADDAVGGSDQSVQEARKIAKLLNFTKFVDQMSSLETVETVPDVDHQGSAHLKSSSSTFQAENGHLQQWPQSTSEVLESPTSGELSDTDTSSSSSSSSSAAEPSMRWSKFKTRLKQIRKVFGQSSTSDSTSSSSSSSSSTTTSTFWSDSYRSGSNPWPSSRRSTYQRTSENLRRRYKDSVHRKTTTTIGSQSAASSGVNKSPTFVISETKETNGPSKPSEPRISDHVTSTSGHPVPDETRYQNDSISEPIENGDRRELTDSIVDDDVSIKSMQVSRTTSGHHDAGETRHQNASVSEPIENGDRREPTESIVDNKVSTKSMQEHFSTSEDGDDDDDDNDGEDRRSTPPEVNAQLQAESSEVARGSLTSRSMSDEDMASVNAEEPNGHDDRRPPTLETIENEPEQSASESVAEMVVVDKRLFLIRHNQQMVDDDVQSTLLRRERRREKRSKAHVPSSPAWPSSFSRWVQEKPDAPSSLTTTTRIAIQSEAVDGSEDVAHPLVAVRATAKGNDRRTVADSISWREVEFLIDNSSRYLLLLGGRRKDRPKGHRSPMLTLDVKQMRWDDAGTMPMARRNAAAVVSNRRGEVLVIGGYGFIFEQPRLRLFEQVTDTVLRYASHETPAWQSRTRMKVARAYHSAAAIIGSCGNDVIIVVGGIDQHKRILSLAEKYRWTDDEWTEIAPMPVALLGAAIHVHDDGATIFVVGGMIEVDAGGRVPTDTVLSYIIATDSWHILDPLRRPKAYASIVSHELGPFLVGGVTSCKDGEVDDDGRRHPRLVSSDEIEVYSSDLGRWQIAATMSQPRHGAAAVFIGDYLMVIGGSQVLKDRSVVTSECYDVRNRQWLYGTPKMPFPVFGGSLVAVNAKLSTPMVKRHRVDSIRSLHLQMETKRLEDYPIDQSAASCPNDSPSLDRDTWKT